MYYCELKKWKMCGFHPYAPLLGKSMELGAELKGQTEWMDVDVPHSVYADLIKAGYIDDPFYEDNSLKCEWVAERWWVYETAAEITGPVSGRLKLRFNGLCYKARIYLNGAEIARHENMFTPCETDITDKYVIGRNLVRVIIEHQADEYGQAGYTSDTGTQRSRYDFKWDFSTRLINAGIIKKAELYETPPACVKSYYFNSRSVTRGVVAVDAEIESALSCEAGVRLVFDGKAHNFTRQLAAGSNNAVFEFDAGLPELWYPNGCGGQKQYDFRIELTVCGLTQVLESKVGFKEFSLTKNDGAPDGALNYVFSVNGRRVFVKGVNMVPIEHLAGTETPDKYKRLLTSLKNMNVNLIRVWGGGVIESDCFYQLCCEYGIMVWQDFIQSSSGIDNRPSERSDFLKNFAATCEFATKHRRNYVCLAVFCGGNELLYGDWRPVGFENENIKIAHEIVKANCPSVPMLPATPSGPRFSPSADEPMNNHDVHGEWTYQGETEHYKRYNTMRYLFHSEFGVDGLTNPSAAAKFMSAGNLAVIDADANGVWRHKGEWWNSYKRDVKIFGGHIKTFKEFAACSQFMQYEGLRYILESDRRNAFTNSGCIIWQANEPWPNICCTNLIDYYGVEKFACKAVKCVYDKFVPGLKYESLIYGAGEKASFGFYLISEETGAKAALSCEIRAGGRLIYSLAKDIITNGRCDFIENISVTVPKGKSLEFTLSAAAGGNVYTNNILLLIRQEDGFCDVGPVMKFVKSHNNRKKD